MKKAAKKKTVNKGGRPKIYSPSQLSKIGEELIEWCYQNGNWHVSAFEAEKGLVVDFCRNIARDRKDEFLPVYRRAKSILGHKIIQKAMDGGADRWVVATLTPHYLSDIDDYLDHRKEKELMMIEKAKNIAETQINEKAEGIISAADALSEDHSERTK